MATSFRLASRLPRAPTSAAASTCSAKPARRRSHSRAASRLLSRRHRSSRRPPRALRSAWARKRNPGLGAGDPGFAFLQVPANPESRRPNRVFSVGLLDRLAPRKTEPDGRPQGMSASASADDPVFSTKALRKFLASLTARESPVLLDLGPVVGSNVSFFGEQLGCKIFVEDIFADVDRHVRENRLEDLAAFFKKRLPQEENTVDGILCWDVIDYLDRAAAQELASELMRV